MVTVAQIQPIAVTFSPPERQLAALREALHKGPVQVTALPNDGSKTPVKGEIAFIDNTVDPQYGTIRVKARFGNEEQRFWPGTYASVQAVVQVLKGVLSVPPQAVVTGPEGRFVYAVQADGKVARMPVQVLATTAEAAVVEGAAGHAGGAGRVQNLRPAAPCARPRRARPPRPLWPLRLLPGSTDTMTLSELCIRRPVMTVLLCLAVIVSGIVLYPTIPIAALPSFNSPVIRSRRRCPGQSRDHGRFGGHPAGEAVRHHPRVTVISSSNTLGNSSITIEFNNDRDIDAAAVDVQAALFRAQRSLPIEMTVPPSYRKVNPADAPVLLLAINSPAMSLGELNAFGDNLISPSLATLPGVARAGVRPEALRRARTRSPDAPRRAG